MSAMAVRVLIVDDHAEFRAVTRELLEEAGYVVSGEATGARDAIAAVAVQAPDVVLLDVVLPDGYGRRLSGCGARGFVSKSRLSAETIASVLA
jgi:two-component system, OmpR family, KDP operon response regulator KdpE